MDSPPPSPIVPLSSQVGGHAGVLTTEDGSLIIKPALPLELEFYQKHSSHPSFEPLRPFLPKFFGTLKLEGTVDETKPESLTNIVLENISYSFSKPNILDIKLGTVLYDEAAPADKRARMEKTARETTSREAGIRLTGFQVHDNRTSQPVSTPKTYGKSIKVSELPDGIARFFPLATTVHPSAKGADPSEPSLGLPPSLLLPILECLREDIVEIQEAFQQVHLRMVGGSLLIVYEGDWEQAAEGINTFFKEGDSEEEEEEEDDESDEEDGKKRPHPPYSVNLIDFAHTRIKPGEGPDEGVLLGLSTVLKLLDGRIEQVRNAV